MEDLRKIQKKEVGAESAADGGHVCANTTAVYTGTGSQAERRALGFHI